MHEGRGYRYTFQRARIASSPEVPKVTWWKIATFLGYHLHWLTSLETSRHCRKIALRLGIFLAMFRKCLYVVARQLAPKCRDFSNVAKLARQCKWPLYEITREIFLPSEIPHCIQLWKQCNQKFAGIFVHRKWVYTVQVIRKASTNWAIYNVVRIWLQPIATNAFSMGQLVATKFPTK